MTHCATNSAFAVDKAWIAGVNQSWSAGAFWSPSGSPTGTDNAFTTSAGTGAILVDVNASVNNFTSTSSANPIGASGRTLTVNGNVVKTGSAATWDFRQSTWVSGP